MNLYGWNTINSILSIRTNINTCIILLPTILLSHLSATRFRTFQRLYKMISSCACLASTPLAGITFAGLITCSAISFPVALIISTTIIFTLCPSFNLKAFERQQLYEIWPYMGSLTICPCVYHPTYSSSNSSCSKVHLNMEIRMYGPSFGPQLLSMKSTSSSQYLTSVYEAWSFWGLEPYPYHSTPSESPSWTLYLATWGGYISQLCSPSRPKTSPVPCCLAFLFSSPLEFRLYISSHSSPPTAGKSIQHYRN